MDTKRSIVDWDEDEVQNWLVTLGFPQYGSNIKEHRISGDILCMLDQETLKGVGIATVGQRLSILKAVYNLKIASNIPIEADSYVPPSEGPVLSLENEGPVLSLEKLNKKLSVQAQRLRVLEEENQHLNTTLQSLLDDFNALRTSLTQPSSLPTTPESTLSPAPESSPALRRQPPFKWAQYFKLAKSPTKPEIVSESLQQQLEPDVPPPTATPPSRPSPGSSVTDSPSSSPNLKPLNKLSLDDPTYKILPSALKRCKIYNDSWQNYNMFICYGSPGNRIEWRLSDDEKPLLLFQKLNEAKKNPVFLLKHVKDLRSPIVVLGKAGSDMAPGRSPGHTKSASSSILRPKADVYDNVPSSGGWPETPGIYISSPSCD